VGALAPGFSYLSDDQKNATEGQLLLMYYQLSGQYELERIERRGYKLDELAVQIKECARLINLLRLSNSRLKLEHSLLQEIAASEGYTLYLGLKLVVPALLEGIDAATSGRKKAVRDFISFINERRLYWVWGGSSVATILSLLPTYVADTSLATSVLGWTGLIGGSMSWILYFMRAGLVWSSLIEHTFEFAMTDEERALGLTFQERWTTQWKMRKYRLMNDSIWGLCNIACFFVFTGSGYFGLLGNAFTAALLLMDAVLTAWRMYEEEADHQANILRYQNDIHTLEKQIRWAESMHEGDSASIETLKLSLRDSKRRVVMTQLDWKYKKINTSLDLLYSTCLLSAFLLLCCSVVFSPPTALILAVVGVILCYSLNLLYAGATMTVNVSKAKKMQQLADEELQGQMALFIQLAKTRDASKGDLTKKSESVQLDSRMRILYLSLKELRAESEYQRQMVSHQRTRMIISIIRDVLIPPLFIFSLVFLPMGVGVPLLVLSLSLAIGLYYVLSKTQPKKDEVLKDFPEAAYRSFSKNALCHMPNALKNDLDEDNIVTSDLTHKPLPF
jgi:hypothetical protein